MSIAWKLLDNFTPIGPGVRAGRRLAQNVADDTTVLRGLFRQAFGQRKKTDGERRTAWRIGREENTRRRFEIARETYGTSDDDIAELQDRQYKVWRLYMCLLALVVVYELHALTTYGFSLLDVAYLAPLAVCVSYLTVSGYSNYVARSRFLVPVGYWLRRPSLWLPELTDDAPVERGLWHGPAGLTLLVGGAYLATSLGVHTAFAQAYSSLASPPGIGGGVGISGPAGVLPMLQSQDLWFRMLGYVFPGIGPIPADSTPLADGIAGGFASFIAALMAMGGGMICYQTLSALIETAHDGSLLGHHWHAFWAPVRVVYGMASLVPVAKGLCLLQLLVVWVAIISGQLGNAAWTGFASNFTSVPPVGQAQLTQTLGATREAAYLSICLATQSMLNSGSKSPTANAEPPAYVVSDLDAAGNGIIPPKASTAPNPIMPASGVGGTSHLYPVTPAGPAVASQRYIWSYPGCGVMTLTVPYSTNGTPGSALGEDQANAVAGMIDAAQTFGNKLVDAAFLLKKQSPAAAETVTRSSFGTLLEANSIYSHDMLTAGQRYLKAKAQTTAGTGKGTGSSALTSAANGSLAGFNLSAATDGWASAGALYFSLATINHSILSATQRVPTVEYHINIGPLLDTLKSNAKDSGGEYVGLFRQFNSLWSENINAYVGKSVTPKAADLASISRPRNKKGLLAEFLSLRDSLTTSLVNSTAVLTPGSDSGLIEIAHMGHVFIDGSLALLGVALGLSIITLMLPAAGLMAAPATGGLSAVGGMALGFLAHLLAGGISAGQLLFMMLGIAGLIAGIYDAYILPLLPAIYFFLAVLGILILFVEGFIAAPLWAFAHVRMDGQELADNAQIPGYRILFGLLFRIPLTLFGLMFAMAVFNAGVWFLSKTLWPAVLSTGILGSYDVHGVIQSLVVIVIFTGVNYVLADRSFRLITEVPDRVSRWFGSGMSIGHGDESHTVVAAIGGVRHRVEEHTTGAAKGLQGVAGSMGRAGRSNGSERGGDMRRIAGSVEGGDTGGGEGT